MREHLGGVCWCGIVRSLCTNYSVLVVFGVRVSPRIRYSRKKVLFAQNGFSWLFSAGGAFLTNAASPSMKLSETGSTSLSGTGFLPWQGRAWWMEQCSVDRAKKSENVGRAHDGFSDLLFNVGIPPCCQESECPKVVAQSRDHTEGESSTTWK